MVNPENIYVGRPHGILGDEGYGNPYRVAIHGRQNMIKLFTKNIVQLVSAERIHRLRKASCLSCWYNKDLNCHADILLSL